MGNLNKNPIELINSEMNKKNSILVLYIRKNFDVSGSWGKKYFRPVSRWGNRKFDPSMKQAVIAPPPGADPALRSPRILVIPTSFGLVSLNVLIPLG
jgi:hypothetical protein